MIEVDSLSCGYFNETIIKDISFHIQKGELFGIIGPNGSGKTTLLKTISRILAIKQGEIRIKDEPISLYDTKKFAQLVAVLPQNAVQTFSYTVKETVSLGRYAHQKGLFQSMSEEDESIIQDVMKQTGVEAYQHDAIDTLSGGERQRVFLAQALAQDPEILLLDEPTNHLDIAYQKELLDVLKSWTKEKDLTVISIFHDLNLAGLYCDRLLLLQDGKKVICDNSNEVLKRERIQDVYGAAIEAHPHPKVAKTQMMLVPSFFARQRNVIISEDLLQITDEKITLETSEPLRTMSSGVTGDGVGWHSAFVNRHVDQTYNCSDHKLEMKDYLIANGFHPNDTVGMMTAAWLSDVSFHFLEAEACSVFIVVTAASGNAVDASRGQKRTMEIKPGTINIWVLVNGKLSEEAFIQSIMTATEAKVSAIKEMGILDAETNTTATGTSTDSILIGASQQGKVLSYGGTATPLGQLVGKGVYQCTKKALENYFKRRNSR
ncbi:adenosylcobinamide amidohydrolase [Virgibacillus oceani]